jgi:sterol 24-C-methyltransferase
MATITNINKGKSVGTKVNTYTELFEDERASQSERESKKESRKSNYTTVANSYYDIATDFYEYGWGSSFHFAPRHAKVSCLSDEVNCSLPQI